jgi:hypothetical protein
MTIKVREVEEAIEKGGASPVLAGHSSSKSQIVEMDDGRKVFHKQYFSRPAGTGGTTVKWDRGPNFFKMVYSMAGPMYIANVPIETHVASEVATVRAWEREGLPVAKVLDWDGDKTIVFEHMEGHTLDTELEGRLNESAFSNLLDCWGQVRKIAGNYGDKTMLHSDPYADNFFRDEGRGRVVPFDPAKTVKPDMGFDEADARMNLLFLSKLFLLDTDWEGKTRYVQQTVYRLTRKEKSFAAELNFDPVEQRAYFAEYPLPEKNILDIYFREDVREVVQGALTRKQG